MKNYGENGEVNARLDGLDVRADNHDSRLDYVSGKTDELDAALLEGITGLYDHKGGYDAATNTPDLDVSPSGVKKGDAYTVSSTGDFYTENVDAGDVLVADQDDPTQLSHWTRVNKNFSFGEAAGTAAEGNDSRIPTQDENDALTGSAGSPSSSNTFVTDQDTRVPTQDENDALQGASGTPSSSNTYLTEDNINDAASGVGNVWSGDKIQSELDSKAVDISQNASGLVNHAAETSSDAVHGILLDKLDATDIPTPDDDSNDGYGVGSKWLIPSTGKLYRCTDATVGAAVWQETASSSDSGFDVTKLEGYGLKVTVTANSDTTDIFSSLDPFHNSTGSLVIDVGGSLAGWSGNTLGITTLNNQNYTQGTQSGVVKFDITGPPWGSTLATHYADVPAGFYWYCFPNGTSFKFWYDRTLCFAKMPGSSSDVYPDQAGCLWLGDPEAGGEFICGPTIEEGYSLNHFNLFADEDIGGSLPDSYLLAQGGSTVEIFFNENASWNTSASVGLVTWLNPGALQHANASKFSFRLQSGTWSTFADLTPGFYEYDFPYTDSAGRGSKIKIWYDKEKYEQFFTGSSADIYCDQLGNTWKGDPDSGGEYVCGPYGSSIDILTHTHNGTNSAQILHSNINDDEPDKHRTINDSASGSTDLWSGEKIQNELNTVSGIAAGEIGTHTHDGADSTQILHSNVSGQTADDHHNQSHEFAGSDHTSSTLANVNSKVSDLIPTYGGLRDIGMGTYAQLPSGGVADRMFWTTDRNQLYRDNGTAWNPLSDSSMVFSQEAHGLTLGDPITWASAGLLQAIDYGATGNDVFLDGPNDDFDTPATNRIPIKWENAYYNSGSELDIGNHTWTDGPGGVGSEVQWNGYTNGTAWGQIKFFVSPGSSPHWEYIATNVQMGLDSVNGGLVTFTLPRDADNDSLGGYFEYYFLYSAWNYAFITNGYDEDIVIAQNGSVYKDSISNSNLVVRWDGQTGPAGVASSPDVTEDIERDPGGAGWNITSGIANLSNIAVVTDVIDSDTIEVAQSGLLDGVSGLTAGLNYLDPDSGYTTSKSEDPSLVYPTLYALTDTSAMILPYVPPKIKHNYTALVAPTPSADASIGYGVNSTWVDTYNKQMYKCIDSTIGNAAWIPINKHRIRVTWSSGGFDDKLLVRIKAAGSFKSTYLTGTILSGREDNQMRYTAKIHVAVDTGNTSAGDNVNTYFGIGGTIHSGAVLKVFEKTDADGNIDWVEIWGRVSTSSEMIMDCHTEALPDNSVTVYHEGLDGTLPVDGVGGYIEIDKKPIYNEGYMSTSDPTKDDDGYATFAGGFESQVGAIWVNTVKKSIFTCADNAAGAARWLGIRIETTDPTVNDDNGDGIAVGTIWTNTTTNTVYICTDNSGGAAVWHVLQKENLDAAVNPATNDDSSDGYTIGSRWFNTTDDRGWVCLNDTVSGAVWKETTQSGGGGSASHSTGVIKASGSDDGDFTNVTDWSGSAGDYESTITHGLDLPSGEPYQLHVTCYKEITSGTVYEAVIPPTIQTVDDTKVKIGMPTDDDLYVDII